MKKLKIAIALMTVMMLLAACGADGDKQTPAETPAEAPQEEPAETPAEAPAYEEAGEPQRDNGLGTPSYSGSIEPDKIITTISMTFETTEFQFPFPAEIPTQCIY